MTTCLKTGVLLTAVMALGSCATLSEEECRTVDWFELGEQDGAFGFRKSRVGDHVRSCLDHELPVDQATYLRGWQAGIPRYCTAQNGYDEGIAGNVYRDACPAEIAEPFEDAYRPARRVYDAEEAVENIAERIATLRANLAPVERSDAAEDQEEAADLRRSITEEERDQRAAEREIRDARDALRLFLQRNPDIRP